MERVRVYGTEDCSACHNTEKQLAKHGVPYDSFNIQEDPEAMKHVSQRAAETDNYTLPYVEFEDDSWNGFRYDKIKELGKIALAEKEL